MGFKNNYVLNVYMCITQIHNSKLTISWKKNQACWSAASLTVLLLTTHCKANSSWSNYTRSNTIRSVYINISVQFVDTE